MAILKALKYLIIIVVFIQLSSLCSVDAAKALYAFGDSFVTTGDGKNGGPAGPPYGMTWPGHAAGRVSDGRNVVDYLVELFQVPNPIPSFKLKNDSEGLSGVNFAQAGAGITFAFGYIPLDTQVDSMESLVKTNALSKAHLRDSVALVSLGINDYGSYNSNGTSKVSNYSMEVKTVVTSVVDGIAFNLMRLYSFGFRNIIVGNLADMACSPFITVDSNYTSCSSNSTVVYESLTHNTLLKHRVKLLNHELQAANIIIVDQTKAFNQLFHHGAKYGFENPLMPCCTGINPLDVHNCGYKDNEGNPNYTVCQHPDKAVIFDSIHPTQAAWEAVVNLYASVSGYTQEGPTLKEWIQKHNI